MRCYSGGQGSLHHSCISPFLTQASPLFTPSLRLLGSVSTNIINCFVCKDIFCQCYPVIFVPCTIKISWTDIMFKSIKSFFFLIAYTLLAGRNGSTLYSWRSDVNLFALILRAPPAVGFLSLVVPSQNTTKTLLASTEENSSTVYEFTSVSNQSDFIPRYSNCVYESQSSGCSESKSC